VKHAPGVKESRGRFRILQLTAAPFPPAIRVVKEGLSLCEAGYQSVVMCPPIPGRPEKEIWNGVTILRPSVLAGSRSTLDKVLYQALFFSPAWYVSLKQVISECKPDVIHVHDIWLGRSVCWASTGQALVMDLHENMPAAVVEYLSGYRGAFKWFNRVVKSPARVLKYERSMLNRCDMVLVVVEEANARVCKAHPTLPAGRVVTVENLESRRFVERPLAPDAKQVLPDGNSVLYVGGFGPHRGLETLIEAHGHLKHWGISSTLYLVGAKESTYLQMLKSLIGRLDIEDRVRLVGWVEADSVLSYIRDASVCVVPHHSNPHTNTTMPHKLYQYMMARKPVLVSSSTPLARTVRAAGAGLVFEAGDPRDCASKIRELLADPAKAGEYARNGFRYVWEEGHNWEEEAAPALLRAYDELLGVARSPVHVPADVTFANEPE